MDLEVRPGTGTTSNVRTGQPTGLTFNWGRDDSLLVLTHQPCRESTNGSICLGPQDLIAYPVNFTS